MDDYDSVRSITIRPNTMHDSMGHDRAKEVKFVR